MGTSFPFSFPPSLLPLLVCMSQVALLCHVFHVVTLCLKRPGNNLSFFYIDFFFSILCHVARKLTEIKDFSRTHLGKVPKLQASLLSSRFWFPMFWPNQSRYLNSFLKTKQFPYLTSASLPSPFPFQPLFFTSYNPVSQLPSILRAL